MSSSSLVNRKRSFPKLEPRSHYETNYSDQPLDVEASSHVKKAKVGTFPIRFHSIFKNILKLFSLKGIACDQLGQMKLLLWVMALLPRW